MTNLSALSPKTIEGLKRLAKALKKRDGIAHSEALEKAAQQIGYPSFQIARQSMETTRASERKTPTP